MITIFLGWVLASVGMLGMSEEELATQPLDSWRARIKAAIRYLGRLTLRSETNLIKAGYVVFHSEKVGQGSKILCSLCHWKKPPFDLGTGQTHIVAPSIAALACL